MAQVKEKSIIFSGPMVKAILEDRKNQTRTVITPQPVIENIPDAHWSIIRKHKTVWSWLRDEKPSFPPLDLCPYGKPGDRLWVRETFTLNEPPSGYIYRATDQDSFRIICEARAKQGLDLKWTPAILMPRKASRILLEITQVRVERVQSISEEDAKAEGCSIGDVTNRWEDGQVLSVAADCRASFAVLWDSINSKRQGGKYAWEKNPWVWAITFKGIQP